MAFPGHVVSAMEMPASVKLELLAEAVIDHNVNLVPVVITIRIPVKVEFFKRGINSFYITSQRPIPIEGITKTISMWVCGRNQSHDLYILIEDYFGRDYELYMGNLGFSGWKKLTCVVPPSPDSEHGIVQHSAYYGDRPGVRILGFRVDCNPMLARGTYYVYFDDLRCVTDLYDMENHDEDDMADNW